MSRLQVIYRARVLHQAHMLKNLLDNYGIQAHVVDPSAAALNDNIECASEVVVAEKDVEAARGIADIFHNHLTSVTEKSETSDSNPLVIIQRSPFKNLKWLGGNHSDEVEEPWVAWNEWPTCPRCEERRQTTCPICDNAGNLFALADVPEGIQTQDLAHLLTSTEFFSHADAETEKDALNTNVLLMCDICDEPFLPTFYRQCEHCGHEFSSGMAPREPEDRAAVSGALFFGTVCLLVYGAAVFYMFIM